MKINLIYNGIGIAGFNPNRPKGDREGSWIAHGISSIGASCIKNGYNISLTDMRQLNSWEDLDVTADIYGISISPVDYWTSLKTILHLKNHNPKCKIIIGGIYPTIHPEKYDFPAIDTIVRGEGEITFVKLLKMAEDGIQLPKYIEGEKPDLDSIPFVKRELFQYYREMECNYSPDQKLPSITMLSGRGCPYKCTYCQPAENSVFGKPYRLRSVDNVLDEMENLQKYNYKSVTFWDDTFTFKTEWVHEFCDKYKMEAKLSVCSRADIICRNEEMVERLAKSGVEWFTIGFETGSQRLLDFIKKGTTIEQNYKAAEICRKYGIKIFGTFMLGLPTETIEESQLTYQMIKQLKPDFASPFYFLPIPGTEIYDYCEENDLILDKDGSIARTGVFKPTIKGIEYDKLNSILGGGN